MVGAQATSRTQSLWPSSTRVIVYFFSVGLYTDKLLRLLQTKRQKHLAHLPPVPDLDSIIAPPRHEPPHAPSPRFTTDQAARRNCRGPTDRIDARTVRREKLVRPIALLEF